VGRLCGVLGVRRRGRRPDLGNLDRGDGGRGARVYVFKASADRFTGIVCGPCNDPASVWRIEDGRLLGDERATFFIRYDSGSGGRRERVEASLSRNAITLLARQESNKAAAPVSSSLTRVVENFELNPQPLPPARANAGRAPVRNIQGRWVSVGRRAQQNWILNVDGGQVWGVVCGPCTPDVVTMIDGVVDGDTVHFYINHIDTPPGSARKGVQRNVMTGTITGGDNANIMKFTWVGEGTGNTGEITMIGPIR
jgi:hypothetical protein